MSDETWVKPTLPAKLQPSGEPSKKRKEKPKAAAPFTPQWNEERAEFLRSVAKRRTDKRLTPEERKTAEQALELSQLAPGMLGYEEAKKAYEMDGAAQTLAKHLKMTPADLIAKWHAEAKLHKNRALNDLPF